MIALSAIFLQFRLVSIFLFAYYRGVWRVLHFKVEQISCEIDFIDGFGLRLHRCVALLVAIVERVGILINRSIGVKWCIVVVDCLKV